MRISDWSSDVCSSDLAEGAADLHAGRLHAELRGADRRNIAPRAAADHHQVVLLVAHLARCPSQGPAQGKFAHLAAGQPDGQGRRAPPWPPGSADLRRARTPAAPPPPRPPPETATAP